MSDHPEQSSPDRRMIIYGFSLVIGGILSIWAAALGRANLFTVLGAFLFGAALGWVFERVALRFASGVVGNIYGAGNITPAPSYPVAETAVIRGKFAEAAEHYRNHLALHPDDYEARLRLADLAVSHLGNLDEAERLYKEVRDARENSWRELTAFNGLIDLHTKAGRQDRLKVELARFAERYAGSKHAVDARRRLDELKNGP
ncbi:MAG TPA: tetratricopeptide repeat protein [Gemmatimonadales bacterium]|nr:tetratricopeptide repeat protein [Gemmatimonadales bacterium]